MKILAALWGGCFGITLYFANLELLEEILGGDMDPALRLTVAILVFVGGFLTVAIATGGGKR